MRTRALGYVRISLDRDESTSLDRQREAIQAAARARGWDLADIVEDVGSATRLRLDRPGLTQVRDRIRSGDADLLLVWRLDRLCRNVGDFTTLLDEGVNVASATEPLDTTSPMGRAMAEILQVFARMEAETTGLRVSSAVNHLRSVGRFPGGPVPYGYTTAPHPDGTGRTLVPHPEHAAVVQEAARKVVNGWSLRAVAKDLNETGRLTARGGQWTSHTLKDVLTRPSTYGYVAVKGTLVTGDDGLPIQQHQPLLDENTHAQLQTILSTNTHTPPRGSRARLLSGLIYCASCSNPLEVHHAGQHVNYTCRANVTAKTCPRPTAVTAHRAETHVITDFLGLVGEAEEEEEVTEVQGSAELAAVNEALRTLAQAMTEDGADIPTLSQQMADLHERRRRIKVATVTRWVPTGQTVEQAWTSLTNTAEQRAFLGDFIEQVVVHPATKRAWQPERVHVHYRERWQPTDLSSAVL